jgi:uncharacterized repeat protein (TIGR01451 family)
MKLRRLIASVFLLGLFLCFGDPTRAASIYGKVIEIVDGDTIRIISLNRPVKVKLAAIDAPEMNQSCGDVAKQHLLDLIFDKMVAVEYFGLSEGGSIDGKVFLSEMDVAAQMVRDGAAWYDKSNASRLSEVERLRYADSEQAARNEHRGIWQESKPVAPWDFRRGLMMSASNQSAPDSSIKRAAKSLTNEELGLEHFSQPGPLIASTDKTRVGDSVASVVAKQLFKDGAISIISNSASGASAPPGGYDFYEGYDIRSEAIAVGHDVTFNVASATDPTVFSGLRILHLESDDMSPTRAHWVDRTLLEPNRLAPNFKTKTVSASTDQLGQFVIARMDGIGIKNAHLVDLSVTTTASPERVEPGDDVRYTIAIRNTGNYSATEVVLNNIIDMRLRIVSATSPRGVCKQSPKSDDTVICDLNNIAPGASAVVTIETKLAQGGPLEVLTLNHIAIVRAKERQANSPNREVVVNQTVRLAQ